MKNRKKTQEYFKKQYYNQKNNYKAILSEIRKDEYMNKNKILKIISTAILTLLGTTSLVFASTKIYNEYIKEQNKLRNTLIWQNDSGISNYDTDLTQNDMILSEASNLYYKIITNVEDYNKYKLRINELPDMSKDSFDENFLVVVVNKNYMELRDRDLTIVNVFADETTTHIILKQKEKPDYDNCDNIWYAIVDNSQLRNNVEIKIDYKHIKNSEKIVDVEYKDKMFVLNWRILGSEDINVGVYKYIIKGNKKDNNLVRYYLTNDTVNYGKGDWKGVPFVSIYQE